MEWLLSRIQGHEPKLLLPTLISMSGPLTSVWRFGITEDGKNRYATLWREPHASIKISKLVGGVGPNLR
jgi:hypothetical protein